MSNKEKFLQLVTSEDTETLKEVKERVKNRTMLHESQQIAIKVLMKLDEMGWTQKDLATEMGVSPQQITKIVSGRENLTIGTQIKLQNILKIPVLASYYENELNSVEELILTLEKRVEVIVAQTNQVNNYRELKTIKMERHVNTPEYFDLAV